MDFAFSPEQEQIRGASIYPAVQNIVLACRGLGLGTVITTNHILYEDEVRAVLGMPAEIATFALMPVGVPLGHVLALVVGPLAASQTQFHLGPAIGEIHRQRHQRQATLANLPGQLVDFGAV